MKKNTMKKLFIVALAAISFAGYSQTLPSPLPSQPNLMGPILMGPIPLGGEASTPPLPPGAVAFDVNGQNFSNVDYKVSFGSEFDSLGGGTLAYAQGDIDIFHMKSLDIGVGAELTFSGQGSGLHSGAVDIELIKNFPNWQLVGKIGFGRQFEDNVGNYGEFGFDVNYNLTKGAGLSFLGTSGGAFTFVGAGVDYAVKNMSISAAKVTTVKKIRIYGGYAF